MGKKNLKLKAALVGADISIPALAEKIGMHRGSLWKKINGKRKFTEQDIADICKVLEMNPTDIFFDCELPNEQQKWA